MVSNVAEASVCANCGILEMAKDSITNEPACAICGGKDFIMSTLPEELKCDDCNKVTKTEKILKMWKSPPFYHSKRGTYYCGCYGWD